MMRIKSLTKIHISGDLKINSSSINRNRDLQHVNFNAGDNEELKASPSMSKEESKSYPAASNPTRVDLSILNRAIEEARASIPIENNNKKDSSISSKILEDVKAENFVDISLVGGKVLKNNYLMSTGPLGQITKLETDIHNDINFRRTNKPEIIPKQQSFSNKSINSGRYLDKIDSNARKSQCLLQKIESKDSNRVSSFKIQANDLKCNIDNNFKSDKSMKLNENFEFTSNGMIRLKSNMLDEESNYLKSRIPQPLQKFELQSKRHSSSIGSLPQINRNKSLKSQVNLSGSDSTKYIRTKRNIHDVISMNKFAESMRNPPQNLPNSKYKNSDLIFVTPSLEDSHIKHSKSDNSSNGLMIQPKIVEMRIDPNKRIARDGYLSNSSSLKEKLNPIQFIKNQESQPISSIISSDQNKSPASPSSPPYKSKRIKPKDTVTVNVAANMQREDQKSSQRNGGSPPALHSPIQSNQQNPISPKMTRTRAKKSNFEKKMAEILAKQNFVYMDREGSTNRVDGFNKTTKEKFKSRNKQSKLLQEFNDQIRKRSTSRESRIEGKLNENEMLPVAKNLGEDELIKYKNPIL